MMSAQAIVSLQAESARRAAEHNLEPYVLFDEETAFDDLRHATNLGDYEPPGWAPAFFFDYVDVDPTGWKLRANQDVCASQFKDELIIWVSKGWGAERSDFDADDLAKLAPALVRRAAERGKVLGFAICDEGEFQCYLRGFEKRG